MIAIKDRTMPRYCAECFVMNCPHKEGAAIRLHYKHEYGRHAGCPLIEIEPSEDCLNREQAKKEIIQWYRESIGNKPVDIDKPIQIIQDLPPVTSIFPKGATNGDALISLYPNLKYTIQNDRVITTIGVASSFDLEWWNASYK